MGTVFSTDPSDTGNVNPWLAIAMDAFRTVARVVLYNSYTNGARLGKAQVRAGTARVDAVSTAGNIGSNALCWTMPGYGTDGSVHDANCDTPIYARYVTVQNFNDISGGDSGYFTLMLREVEIYHSCAQPQPGLPSTTYNNFHIYGNYKLMPKAGSQVWAVESVCYLYDVRNMLYRTWDPSNTSPYSSNNMLYVAGHKDNVGCGSRGHTVLSGSGTITSTGVVTDISFGVTYDSPPIVIVGLSGLKSTYFMIKLVVSYVSTTGFGVYVDSSSASGSTFSSAGFNWLVLDGLPSGGVTYNASANTCARNICAITGRYCAATPRFYHNLKLLSGHGYRALWALTYREGTDVASNTFNLEDNSIWMFGCGYTNGVSMTSAEISYDVLAAYHPFYDASERAGSWGGSIDYSASPVSITATGFSIRLTAGSYVGIDKAVIAWLAIEQGPTSPPLCPASPTHGSLAYALPALATGISTTCVRLNTGKVKCWGQNDNGQAGNSNTANKIGDTSGEMGSSLAVVDLGSSYKALSVGVGHAHGCALLQGGSVKCWSAAATAGQLGLGATTNTMAAMGDSLTAVSLGAGRTARGISVAHYGTCALLDDYSVKCWGSGGYGQNGVGSTSDLNTPPATAVNLGTGRLARQLAKGDQHVCVILDTGFIKCWGRNNYGQLGLGDTTDRGGVSADMGDNLPVVDLGWANRASHMCAGVSHTCAVISSSRSESNGRVKCWGLNTDKQLGFSDTTNRGDGAGAMGESLGYVELGTGAVAVQVACGFAHSWGSGWDGELGNGDRDARAGSLGDSLPTAQLGSGRKSIAIAARGYYTCAIRDDYSVVCFGKVRDLAEEQDAPPPPALVPDTEPPLMSLRGDPVVRLQVYDSYVEYGVSAVDARDGTIAAVVQGADVDTAVTNSEKDPYVVTYTATDRAGNTARLQRRVVVTDDCAKKGEVRCRQTLKCSTLRVCDSSLTAILNYYDNTFSADAFGSSVDATARRDARIAPPDTSPPRITLRGSGTMFVTPTGATGMVHSLYVGDDWVEEGAEAEDDVDEDFGSSSSSSSSGGGSSKRTVVLPGSSIITSTLAPWGARVDSIRTDVPTGDELDGVPWIISYDAVDSAGNKAATVRRRVYVICKPPERECTRMDASEPRTCSMEGICGLNALSGDGVEGSGGGPGTRTEMSTAMGATGDDGSGSSGGSSSGVAGSGSGSGGGKGSTTAAAGASGGLAADGSVVGGGAGGGGLLITALPGSETAASARSTSANAYAYGLQGGSSSASSGSDSGSSKSVSSGGSSGSGRSATYAPATDEADVPDAQRVPRLTLVHDWFVRFKAGRPYDRCKRHDTECDAGVTATLRVPGDLNGKVVACADRAAGVRNPKPYDLVGLQYCGLDTNTSGTYNVTYHLTWPSVGELVVTRMIIVEENCPDGERLCDNGRCSNGPVTCISEIGLGASGIMPTPDTPVFGTGPDAASNAAATPSSSGGAGGTAGSSGTGGGGSPTDGGTSGGGTSGGGTSSGGTSTSGGTATGDAAVVGKPDSIAGGAINATGGVVAERDGATLYTIVGSSLSSNATAAAVAATLPPRLTLTTTAVAGTRVTVPRGVPYLRCELGQVPTAELPCEPLGVARDDMDGDLSDWVTLCPPTDCLRTQCRDHVKKQPAACGVDTVGGDVGSAYTLRLAVFNSRGLNATAERVVAVGSPCAPGCYWCPDTSGSSSASALLAGISNATAAGAAGTLMGGGAASYVCSELPCDQRVVIEAMRAAAAVAAAEAAAAAAAAAGTNATSTAAGGSGSGSTSGSGATPGGTVFTAAMLVAHSNGTVNASTSTAPNSVDFGAPPRMFLLPSRHAANMSAAESNQSLTLTYRAPAPFSLAPCVAVADILTALPAAATAAPPPPPLAAGSNGTNNTSGGGVLGSGAACAAVAVDNDGIDLTPFITVAVAQLCPGVSSSTNGSTAPGSAGTPTVGGASSTAGGTDGLAAATEATWSCGAGCSVAQLTTGTCLPGTYRLTYSVENTAGVATALQLVVAVEELRTTQLDVTLHPAGLPANTTTTAAANFSSPEALASSWPAMAQLAAELSSNSTALAAALAPLLPSLGLSAADLRSVNLPSPPSPPAPPRPLYGLQIKVSVTTGIADCLYTSPSLSDYLLDAVAAASDEYAAGSGDSSVAAHRHRRQLLRVRDEAEAATWEDAEDSPAPWDRHQHHPHQDAAGAAAAGLPAPPRALPSGLHRSLQSLRALDRYLDAAVRLILRPLLEAAAASDAAEEEQQEAAAATRKAAAAVVAEAAAADEEGRAASDGGVSKGSCAAAEAPPADGVSFGSASTTIKETKASSTLAPAADRRALAAAKPPTSSLRAALTPQLLAATPLHHRRRLLQRVLVGSGGCGCNPPPTASLVTLSTTRSTTSAYAAAAPPPSPSSGPAADRPVITTTTAVGSVVSSQCVSPAVEGADALVGLLAGTISTLDRFGLELEAQQPAILTAAANVNTRFEEVDKRYAEGVGHWASSAQATVENIARNAELLSLVANDTGSTSGQTEVVKALLEGVPDLMKALLAESADSAKASTVTTTAVIEGYGINSTAPSAPEEGAFCNCLKNRKPDGAGAALSFAAVSGASPAAANGNSSSSAAADGNATAPGTPPPLAPPASAAPPSVIAQPPPSPPSPASRRRDLAANSAAREQGSSASNGAEREERNPHLDLPRRPVAKRTWPAPSPPGLLTAAADAAQQHPQQSSAHKHKPQAISLSPSHLHGQNEQRGAHVQNVQHPTAAVGAAPLAESAAGDQTASRQQHHQQRPQRHRHEGPPVCDTAAKQPLAPGAASTAAGVLHPSSAAAAGGNGGGGGPIARLLGGLVRRILATTTAASDVGGSLGSAATSKDRAPTVSRSGGARLGDRVEFVNGHAVLVGQTFDYSLYHLRNAVRTRKLTPIGENNQVLGGLLLHQLRLSDVDLAKRAGTSDCGVGHFAHLITACRRPDTTAAATTAAANASAALSYGAHLASGTLGGIGSDPTFMMRSGLYRPDLDPADYYNSTPGSPEVNAFGVPYGFFHEPMRRQPDGYPVILDIGLSEQRVLQALQYLKDGSYLSPSATKSMLALLVTYNPDASVFGYSALRFTWRDNGVIGAEAQVLGLPAVNWAHSLHNFNDASQRVAPDILLLVLCLLYVGMSLSDIAQQIMAQRRQRELKQLQQEAIEEIEATNRAASAAALRGGSRRRGSSSRPVSAVSAGGASEAPTDIDDDDGSDGSSGSGGSAWVGRDPSRAGSRGANGNGNSSKRSLRKQASDLVDDETHYGGMDLRPQLRGASASRLKSRPTTAARAVLPDSAAAVAGGTAAAAVLAEAGMLPGSITNQRSTRRLQAQQAQGRGSADHAAAATAGPVAEGMEVGARVPLDDPEGFLTASFMTPEGAELLAPYHSAAADTNAGAGSFNGQKQQQQHGGAQRIEPQLRLSPACTSVPPQQQQPSGSSATAEAGADGGKGGGAGSAASGGVDERGDDNNDATAEDVAAADALAAAAATQFGHVRLFVVEDRGKYVRGSHAEAGGATAATAGSTVDVTAKHDLLRRLGGVRFTGADISRAARLQLLRAAGLATGQAAGGHRLRRGDPSALLKAAQYEQKLRSERMGATDTAGDTQSAGRGLRGLGKTITEVRYRPRMNTFWIVWELAICCLMVAAMATYFTYCVRLSNQDQFFVKLNVYDADTFAPARYFLLRRQEPPVGVYASNDSAVTATAGSSAAASANLSTGSLAHRRLQQTDSSNATTATPDASAGSSSGGADSSSTLPYTGTETFNLTVLPTGPNYDGAGRWQLPVDYSGLQNAGDMFSRVQLMYDTLLVYNMLQCFVLTLIILRLLFYMSFQPHLSLIAGTLALAVPDLLHFGIVVIICAVMYVGAVNCVFGVDQEQLSTYSAGTSYLLKFLMFGESEGVFMNLLWDNQIKSTAETWIARAVYLIGPFFFGMILMICVMVILFAPYFALKKGVKGAPTVPRDIYLILRWRLQHYLQRAPKNKQIVRLIDDRVAPDTPPSNQPPSTGRPPKPMPLTSSSHPAPPPPPPPHSFLKRLRCMAGSSASSGNSCDQLQAQDSGQAAAQKGLQGGGAGPPAGGAPQAAALGTTAAASASAAAHGTDKHDANLALLRTLSSSSDEFVIPSEPISPAGGGAWGPGHAHMGSAAVVLAARSGIQHTGSCSSIPYATPSEVSLHGAIAAGGSFSGSMGGHGRGGGPTAALLSSGGGSGSRRNSRVVPEPVAAAGDWAMTSGGSWVSAGAGGTGADAVARSSPQQVFGSPEARASPGGGAGGGIGAHSSAGGGLMARLGSLTHHAHGAHSPRVLPLPPQLGGGGRGVSRTADGEYRGAGSNVSGRLSTGGGTSMSADSNIVEWMPPVALAPGEAAARSSSPPQPPQSAGLPTSPRADISAAGGAPVAGSSGPHPLAMLQPHGHHGHHGHHHHHHIHNQPSRLSQTSAASALLLHDHPAAAAAQHLDPAGSSSLHRAHASRAAAQVAATPPMSPAGLGAGASGGDGATDLSPPTLLVVSKSRAMPMGGASSPSSTPAAAAGSGARSVSAEDRRRAEQMEESEAVTRFAASPAAQTPQHMAGGLQPLQQAPTARSLPRAAAGGLSPPSSSSSSSPSAARVPGGRTAALGAVGRGDVDVEELVELVAEDTGPRGVSEDGDGWYEQEDTEEQQRRRGGRGQGAVPTRSRGASRAWAVASEDGEGSHRQGQPGASSQQQQQRQQQPAGDERVGPSDRWGGSRPPAGTPLPPPGDYTEQALSRAALSRHSEVVGQASLLVAAGDGGGPWRPRSAAHHGPPGTGGAGAAALSHGPPEDSWAVPLKNMATQQSQWGTDGVGLQRSAKVRSQSRVGQQPSGGAAAASPTGSSGDDDVSAYGDDEGAVEQNPAASDKVEELEGVPKIRKPVPELMQLMSFAPTRGGGGAQQATFGRSHVTAAAAAEEDFLDAFLAEPERAPMTMHRGAGGTSLHSTAHHAAAHGAGGSAGPSPPRPGAAGVRSHAHLPPAGNMSPMGGGPGPIGEAHEEEGDDWHQPRQHAVCEITPRQSAPTTGTGMAAAPAASEPAAAHSGVGVGSKPAGHTAAPAMAGPRRRSVEYALDSADDKQQQQQRRPKLAKDAPGSVSRVKFAEPQLPPSPAAKRTPEVGAANTGPSRPELPPCSICEKHRAKAAEARAKQQRKEQQQRSEEEGKKQHTHPNQQPYRPRDDGLLVQQRQEWQQLRYLAEHLADDLQSRVDELNACLRNTQVMMLGLEALHHAVRDAMWTQRRLWELQRTQRELQAALEEPVDDEARAYRQQLLEHAQQEQLQLQQQLVQQKAQLCVATTAAQPLPAARTATLASVAAPATAGGGFRTLLARGSVAWQAALTAMQVAAEELPWIAGGEVADVMASESQPEGWVVSNKDVQDLSALMLDLRSRIDLMYGDGGVGETQRRWRWLSRLPGVTRDAGGGRQCASGSEADAGDLAAAVAAAIGAAAESHGDAVSLRATMRAVSQHRGIATVTASRRAAATTTAVSRWWGSRLEANGPFRRAMAGWLADVEEVASGLASQREAERRQARDEQLQQRSRWLQRLRHELLQRAVVRTVPVQPAGAAGHVGPAVQPVPEVASLGDTILGAIIAAPGGKPPLSYPRPKPQHGGLPPLTEADWAGRRWRARRERTGPQPRSEGQAGQGPDQDQLGGRKRQRPGPYGTLPQYTVDDWEEHYQVCKRCRDCQAGAGAAGSGVADSDNAAVASTVRVHM
ncbi:hypothetical protein HXX76_001099 [Chlamydomonas incerta]|uniref:Pesticidal crystal protein Cry22Aa Ig-like domain-containing protein n=1 Tax=Chlamydomonas incerta TaxID=51695 RepID=A0A835WBP2_CHLIN|nr:hypothetical protein HXX76_001099 [Chlamydomonas incerta]|eukprot:KAG2444343.1 hypothetical protein HXX76_001099 [Chlamydomonas incerta]